MKKEIPNYFQWTYKKWYFWLSLTIYLLLVISGMYIENFYNLSIAETVGFIFGKIFQVHLYFCIFYFFYRLGRKE